MYRYKNLKCFPLNQFNTLWDNKKIHQPNIRQNNRKLMKLLSSKSAAKYDAINFSAVALQSHRSHALWWNRKPYIIDSFFIQFNCHKTLL